MDRLPEAKTEIMQKAAPLLIGIDPNSSVDGRRAYEIKSVYGRENFTNWLVQRAKDSKILAGDKNKATALLRDVGIDITEPVAYAADLTSRILAQNADKVKKSDGQARTRYSMIEEPEGTPAAAGHG